ncbi:PPDK_N domain-containing protein [Trichonephila inaurata madagascariensis]|uniref:PPDK_N domain-containing protein n=1 Tax=Trichonephila inaurata madagascariensis TaxID=2747483 RepID=A0A8X6XM44_9ARAC|nr:PPDK_N domain-containing protein [Trichonephila inaurata madagascariensis]
MTFWGDFAKLLATSSDVESANIPQAMQEVADQIAKDIDCGEFKSMSPKQAEEWLQASTSLAGYKFRQFLKRHGHRCLGERPIGADLTIALLVLLECTGARRLIRTSGLFVHHVDFPFIQETCHRPPRRQSAKSDRPRQWIDSGTPSRKL